MVSDLEFVLELRRTVARYLRAVDEWESAYRKFSHHVGMQRGLSPELDRAQAEYRAARKELEAGIPRARRLGLRYGVRDPWAGLLRLAMGQSSIGRNERAAITDCLDQLMAACKEDENTPEKPTGGPVSWLHRVKNYFL
jgi:hypothetical protein